MAENFKPGDLVELLSGGPTMTVKEKLGGTQGNIHCQWFGGKKLESGVFAKESLRRVTLDEKKG